MNGSSVPRQTRWLWWVVTALLGAALVVDVIDGHPWKLATSALLFIGSLLSAAWPLPRPNAVTGVVVACFGLAGLLILVRVFGFTS